MYKTILLTGIPRSGSTLSCNILNDFKNTLALMEPMNVGKLEPKKGNIEAIKEIANFALESRRKVLYESKVQTKHKDGIVPTNPLENSESGTLRKAIVKGGEIDINRNIHKDFTLIIKHNAFFTAILKDLTNFFQCYGIIRNPLSVLASWNTVDLPVNKGHVPAGERYDRELEEKLNLEEDVLNRQLIILDWFFEKFNKNLPSKNIIRYESIIEDGYLAFDTLSYDSQIEGEKRVFKNKNASKQYKDVDITKIYHRLLNSDGCYWNYYTVDDVKEIYKKLKPEVYDE